MGAYVCTGAHKHNVVAVMLIFMGAYFLWVNIENER